MKQRSSIQSRSRNYDENVTNRHKIPIIKPTKKKRCHANTKVSSKKGKQMQAPEHVGECDQSTVIQLQEQLQRENVMVKNGKRSNLMVTQLSTIFESMLSIPDEMDEVNDASKTPPIIQIPASQILPQMQEKAQSSKIVETHGQEVTRDTFFKDINAPGQMLQNMEMPNNLELNIFKIRRQVVFSEDNIKRKLKVTKGLSSISLNVKTCNGSSMSESNHTSNDHSDMDDNLNQHQYDQIDLDHEVQAINSKHTKIFQNLDDDFDFSEPTQKISMINDVQNLDLDIYIDLSTLQGLPCELDSDQYETQDVTMEPQPDHHQSDFFIPDTIQFGQFEQFSINDQENAGANQLKIVLNLTTIDEETNCLDQTRDSTLKNSKERLKESDNDDDDKDQFD